MPLALAYEIFQTSVLVHDDVIDNDAMAVMLFTSGTTSQSKAVMLSNTNLVSNIYDIGSVFNIDENDTLLSFLPLHHVFECTVGFLFSLYKGAQTSFCDGIKYIVHPAFETDKNSN